MSYHESCSCSDIFRVVQVRGRDAVTAMAYAVSLVTDLEDLVIWDIADGLRLLWITEELERQSCRKNLGELTTTLLTKAVMQSVNMAAALCTSCAP